MTNEPFQAAHTRNLHAHHITRTHSLHDNYVDVARTHTQIIISFLLPRYTHFIHIYTDYECVCLPRKCNFAVSYHYHNHIIISWSSQSKFILFGKGIYDTHCRMLLLFQKPVSISFQVAFTLVKQSSGIKGLLKRKHRKIFRIFYMSYVMYSASNKNPAQPRWKNYTLGSPKTLHFLLLRLLALLEKSRCWFCCAPSASNWILLPLSIHPAASVLVVSAGGDK